MIHFARETRLACGVLSFAGVMSKFYGTLSGQAKTTATRRGGPSSGIETQAASWAGAISVRLFEKDGEERFAVEMIPWHGSGDRQLLVTGKVGDLNSVLHFNGENR